MIIFLTANRVGANVALAICVGFADLASGAFHGTNASAVKVGFILVQNAVGASRGHCKFQH